jgi:hypothetical protein
MERAGSGGARFEFLSGKPNFFMFSLIFSDKL